MVDPSDATERTEHRRRALAALRQLAEALRTTPATPQLDGLVELVEGLERAVEAFHLEGIRFRMYTLEYRLRQLSDSPGAAQARELFREVRTALEGAGFHTRSH